MVQMYMKFPNYTQTNQGRQISYSVIQLLTIHNSRNLLPLQYDKDNI